MKVRRRYGLKKLPVRECGVETHRTGVLARRKMKVVGEKS